MTDIYTMQNGKITEDECVEILNEMKRQSQAMLENPTTFYSQNNILSGCETMKKHIFAYDIAIKALEEIQQYRAIGTVEKVQEYKEIVDNMNAVSMAALCVSLNKLKKYEAIGTIEECRAVVEQLKSAKEDIRKLLCGEYGSSCQFCIQNDNEDAICSKVCGSGSWCCENAAWKSHKLEMLKNEIKQ